MKFSVVAASLFAAQALAEVSSVWETTTELSTTTSTDTECAETVTDCPARKGNDTEGPTTYEDAAAGLSGSFAAVAGAALVAGAVLGL